MPFRISYTLLSSASRGMSQGYPSGYEITADTVEDAIIDFAQEMQIKHPNAAVVVDAGKVKLHDDQIRQLNKSGIEYERGVKAPNIEVVGVEEINAPAG